eukprot:3437232-Rhodomonas_salina.1
MPPPTLPPMCCDQELGVDLHRRLPRCEDLELSTSTSDASKESTLFLDPGFPKLPTRTSAYLGS